MSKRETDEIRITPDALISLVVTEAEERELAAMPSLKEMNAQFHPSEQFQAKMERLLKKSAPQRRMAPSMEAYKEDTSGIYQRCNRAGLCLPSRQGGSRCHRGYLHSVAGWIYEHYLFCRG